MNKEELQELKPAIKFLLENITHNEISDKDVDIFANGGRMYFRQHVGYNYDISGSFKIVKDTEISGGEE